MSCSTLSWQRRNPPTGMYGAMAHVLDIAGVPFTVPVHPDVCVYSYGVQLRPREVSSRIIRRSITRTRDWEALLRPNSLRVCISASKM